MKAITLQKIGEDGDNSTSYRSATEKGSKSEKLQCATFLALAGEAAIEVFNTFPLSTAEKDKIEPLMEKFEEYCMPK